MHLTLKQETTRPAAKNFLQQQARFDRFIECFNQERPHQALGMKYPCGHPPELGNIALRLQVCPILTR
jgi:transposase InsO family protein